MPAAPLKQRPDTKRGDIAETGFTRQECKTTFSRSHRAHSAQQIGDLKADQRAQKGMIFFKPFFFFGLLLEVDCLSVCDDEEELAPFAAGALSGF